MPHAGHRRWRQAVLPAALPALMPSVPFCEHSKGKTVGLAGQPSGIQSPLSKCYVAAALLKPFDSLPLFATEPGLPLLSQTAQPNYNPSDYLE